MAQQLVHGDIGKNFNVVLGGGYREFLPANVSDPHGRMGRRTDKKDLISEWYFGNNIRGNRVAFVPDKVKKIQISICGWFLKN